MLRRALLLTATVGLAACATSSSTAPNTGLNTSSKPSPDPRPHLKAGWFDAGQAEWNMHLVATAKPAEAFFNPSGATFANFNSDLAFTGHYVVQGNFGGFQVWDVSTPTAPHIVSSVVCGGVQGDPSVYRHLLFLSVESPSGRLDCGLGGVKDSVSTARFRGVRIFDLTDIEHPKKIADVQTCRGSHTNTVIPDPTDPNIVYVYVSALVASRSSSELANCSDVAPTDDPNTERFKIDVIRVPLDHPEQAAVINRPAVLAGLSPYARHTEYAGDTAVEAGMIRMTQADPQGVNAKKLSPLGPIATACHDVTAYTAVNLAGGACIGYGILMDISDPAHPRRIAAASDTNFWGWHSVTFSNDGKQVLFTDEWGGGGFPRCRATDNPKWGGDAIYRIDGGQLTLLGYYKLPVALPPLGNCVAHNGSLIPIPGRTVMAQSWYQGGVSVFDWTDPAHATEIAYFDRGPIDSAKTSDGGTWSAYWYNGYIYSSEITRGLDVLELHASPALTQNEIDAAKTVHFDDLNVQNQPLFIWPATPVLARAYLDQLARNDGLPSRRRAAVAKALDAGDKAGLKAQATQLEQDAATAKDPAKVRALADVLTQLAG